VCRPVLAHLPGFSYDRILRTLYRDGDKAQREFNTIAVRERSKFERETSNRYGGVDYASIPTERGGGLVPGLYDIENAEDRSSIFENTVLYNIN